jgi:hypothetical protein
MFVICTPLFFPRYYKCDQINENEHERRVARMEEM